MIISVDSKLHGDWAIVHGTSISNIALRRLGSKEASLDRALRDRWPWLGAMLGRTFAHKLR
jgi:hypothetical protein